MLEWNALGMWEEAFSVFCEGLATNACLTQLDLRNNQIDQPPGGLGALPGPQAEQHPAGTGSVGLQV